MKDDDQISENFNCIICLQLAINAMETMCCGQLMCEKCSEDIRKRSKNCPNCREDLVTKESKISRRIISTLKIDCPECEMKISAKDRQEHNLICLKKKINCKHCMKFFRIQEIVEHMQASHPTQLLKTLVLSQFQQDREKDSRKSESRIFESKLKNSDGNIAALGDTCKYYCGKKVLIGKCGCCDGRCGPSNGENCDSCMDLDLRRFNLSQGFLINPIGHISKFSNETSNYYCGRNRNGIFCNPETPCRDCQRVKNSVVLGRYSKLI